MDQMLDLTIVIPVYNEAGIIEDVIGDIHKKIIQRLEGAQLIVAEDGSDDGTKEILNRLKEAVPFRLVSSDKRKGYTQAFKDALAIPQTEWIFFCDSDGQHEPDDFFVLAEQAQDYDIISGYKSPRRDPFYRIILSKGYNFLIRILFGLKMNDIDSAFKLIKKDVLVNVLDEIEDLRHCVTSEFVVKAYEKGYRIKEVPIKHYPRPSGNTAIFTPAKLFSIVTGLIWSLWCMKKKLRMNSRKNVAGGGGGA